jgi:DNA repair photolyase
MARARIFPRRSVRALTPTGGYLSGFTHSLQPYVGCQFSCRYCYARELMVQRANPYHLPWSAWISPKLDVAERLQREAARGVTRDARIFCSSATDPYVPLERRLGLTRGCLEVLAAQPPARLVVQTRSPIIVRDAALLVRIPTAIASLSITTDDDAVRRMLEPDAPAIALRIEALGQLRAAGVRTQAAVSPLLPCDAGRLARRLEPIADRVVVDDFFRGDGAGGRRSRAALDRLRSAGFASWAEPGYADAAIAVFRSIFGAERVGVSAAGFDATSSRPVRDRVPSAPLRPTPREKPR